MSYKLEKPYTNIQRVNFICEHQGLNYYEDNNCIIMHLNTEKIVNGEAVDRTQDADYIAEQKKQKKNNAYKTYQQGLIQLKSEDELNQFFKSCGMITQSIYDDRLAVITADLETLKHTYLTEVEDD